MIASVSGEVVVRRPDHVVVDTGGVGYRLAVSSETLRAVPATGKRVVLHAHLVSREDSLSLYGFAAEEERDLFLALITVSGVGPKVAMAALSSGPTRELISALASSDTKRLQAVPGIGKRTAERIVLELRDSAAEQFGEPAAGEPLPEGGTGSGPREEARNGLIGLGYTPQEVECLLAGAKGESAEQLISSALKGGAGSERAAA